MCNIGNILMITAGAAALALTAAAGASEQDRNILTNNAGERIGSVEISKARTGALLRIEVEGLTPGWHGVHVHANADCSDPKFLSAGGHLHAGEADAVHGLLNAQGNEAGDLPNIHINADGTGRAEFHTTLLSLDGTGDLPNLSEGKGAALIIHEQADDHQSQPIGGAGARVACAVIP